MSGRRGIAGMLFDHGTRALSRAAELVMHDPRGQELVARAVGVAQRGKQRLDRVEQQVLHAVGLAARPDYEEVAKRMARLKRQLRELSKRLEQENQRGDR